MLINKGKTYLATFMKEKKVVLDFGHFYQNTRSDSDYIYATGFTEENNSE